MTQTGTDLATPTQPAALDLHRVQFSREQVEIIKRTVAQGTSDDELALFLETARRRGLDPFSGQIHAVMRYDSREGRKVMTIQTGVDGYRAIADRTGRIDWVQGPEWTRDGTTWVDVWLHESPPSAARFTVKLKDRSKEETRVAHWTEYRQTNQQGELTRAWREMSAGMLGKCAEVLALRAALPEHLGGLYTAEETAQPADGETPAAAAAEVDNPDRRRELYRRFAVWRRSADEAEVNEAWQQIRERLRGDGTLTDAFAATPLHVLEEIVETHVPEPDAEPAPDDEDQDDEPPAEPVDDVPGDQDSADAGPGPDDEGRPVDADTGEGGAAEAATNTEPTDAGDARQAEGEPEPSSPGTDIDDWGPPPGPGDRGPQEPDEDEREALIAKVREDWRAAARDADVSLTEVLSALIAAWPTNDQAARPNRLADVDRLVAANVEWAHMVADVIDTEGDA